MISSAWPWLWWRFCGRRALARDRWRIVLVLLGLALVSALSLGFVSASRQSIEAFSSAVGALTGKAQIEIHAAQGVPLTTSAIAPLAKALSRDFFVIPTIDRSAIVAGGDCSSELVNLVGVDQIEAASAARRSEGLAYVLPSESTGELLLARSLATRCNLHPGDELVLTINDQLRSARVATILDDTENQIASNLILVEIQLLQSWLSERGQFDYLIVAPRMLDNAIDHLGTTLTRLTQQIVTLPDLILVNESIRRERGQALLGAFQSNIMIMVLLALMVCGLSVFNFAQAQVQARRNEISTLHTLGVPAIWSVWFVVLEALVLATLGAAIGVLLGGPVINASAELLRSSISGIYVALGSTLRPTLGDEMVVVLVTVQLICALAVAIPALAARKIAPTLATRYVDHTESVRLRIWICVAATSLIAAGSLTLLAQKLHLVLPSHIAALCVVLALGLVSLPTLYWLLRISRALVPVSAPWLLARSTVAGSLHSSGFAVAVNAISIALLVALSLMIASFRETLQSWTESTLHADLYIRSQVPDDALHSARLSQKVVEVIAAIPGVQQLSKFATLNTTISGREVVLAGTDLNAGDSQFQLMDGVLNPSEFVAGQSILLSERAAEQLSARVGDKLKVHHRSLRVTAIYREFGSQDAFAVINYQLLAQILQQEGIRPTIRTLAVFLSDPNQAAQYYAQIQAQFPALRVTVNQELKRNILALFDQTFAITELIRILVVVLCIVGSTVCSLQMLRARARELKTLDVLGTSSQTIRSSIAFEGLTLALPALVLGWIAGVILALLLIYVINPLSFGWSLNISWQPAAFYFPVLALVVTIACSCGAVMVQVGAAMRNARVSDE